MINSAMNRKAKRMTAKTAFQAEVISCWVAEDAVAVEPLVWFLSAALFIAWVTPTPPGVRETLLEIELEAVTEATLWNVTGML